MGSIPTSSKVGAVEYLLECVFFCILYWHISQHQRLFLTSWIRQRFICPLQLSSTLLELIWSSGGVLMHDSIVPVSTVESIVTLILPWPGSIIDELESLQNLKEFDTQTVHLSISKIESLFNCSVMLKASHCCFDFTPHSVTGVPLTFCQPSPPAYLKDPPKPIRDHNKSSKTLEHRQHDFEADCTTMAICYLPGCSVGVCIHWWSFTRVQRMRRSRTLPLKH